MTHQSHAHYLPASHDSGRQLAQLRQVLQLVEQIAGEAAASHDPLDHDARLAAAYDDALPIVQRRFDALAVETAAWAAAGVQALLAADESRPPRAAAAALAAELRKALREMARVLGA